MNIPAKTILILLLFSTVNWLQAKPLSIKLTSDEYPVEISIYHFENSFQTDLLDRIKLDSAYTYVKDIPEIDHYIIKCTKSGGFLPFVWDSNMSISLNAKSVFHSKVIDSKYTDEFYAFVRVQNERIYNKIWKLDTLIKELEKSTKSTDQVLLVGSRLTRQELMAEGPKNWTLFVKAYLRENPTSFSALYMMHTANLELDEADREILKNMPAELKETHRYIHLMDQ